MTFYIFIAAIAFTVGFLTGLIVMAVVAISKDPYFDE